MGTPTETVKDPREPPLPRPEKQGRGAVLAVVVFAALMLGGVAVCLWPVIVWKVREFTKPTYAEYEAMVADGMLLGLTPAEAAEIVGYPASIGRTEDRAWYTFDLEHLGFLGWTWIGGELDDEGRIISAELFDE